MIYTTDDAFEYWCPFVRAVGQKAKKTQAHNVVVEEDVGEIEEEDIGRTPQTSRCVGNKCAMFRHVKPRDETNDEGYCGLAGRPYGL